MSANSSSPKGLDLSAKARRTGQQPISYLMAAVVADPKLINLAAGLVDALTLPVEPVRQISQTLLSDAARGRAALQYDTTQGLAALRRACLHHLETLDNMPAAQMGLSERDLTITTGSQQALYLIADVLIDPGDIVITANPCYFVFTGTLASLGAKVWTVPMDEQGMDVEAVDRLLERLQRDRLLNKVKLIYTTSYFQNPTGLTLSLERRRRLAEIARKFSRRHRIVVLEDAAYRELRYDGPALPSIKSFDPQNQYTVLTQTFSKPFAPGLRLGYTAMPADLLEAVMHQKGNHDFGSSTLAQHIALEAMLSGACERQVRLLCDSYRRKRDTMLEALQRHMPASAGIRWTRPAGGLYVWVTLPEAIDTSRGGKLFESCIERGVIYVPGEYCFQPDENGRVPKNHMRLSFGQVLAEQIEPGVQRLGQAVAFSLATSNQQLATSLE